MKEEPKEDFKHIHIGKLLQMKVENLQISQDRICNFLKITESEVEASYQSESIDSYHLLRWSKLLKYDFFRVYSQHLILYAPPSKPDSDLHKKNMSNNSLPVFKKNIYTKEIINFILELINSNQKTKQEIINEYKIPKTTLYKWIAKYSTNEKT